MEQKNILMFTGTMKSHEQAPQGGKWFNVTMVDNNNQEMKFTTYLAQIATLFLQPNAYNATWQINYTTQPWYAAADKVNNQPKQGAVPQGYNYRIESASMSAAAPVQPPVVNQGINEVLFDGSPSAPPATEPNKYQAPWLSPPLDFTDKLDTTGRSIIRQVAFKDVQNKDDKTPDELWNLTNLYEAILLGSYQPEPNDDSFIQAEF